MRHTPKRKHPYLKQLSVMQEPNNSMSPEWCAARVAEIRAHLDQPGVMRPAHEYRTNVIELLSQLDSRDKTAASLKQELADQERDRLRQIEALWAAEKGLADCYDVITYTANGESLAEKALVLVRAALLQNA
jgi:hypothetical protein